MSKIDDIAPLGIMAIFGLCVIGLCVVFVVDRCAPQPALDAGRSQQNPQIPAGAADLLPRTEAGVQSSRPEAERARASTTREPDQAAGAHVALASQPQGVSRIAILADGLDDEMLPTAEGLHALTLGQWAQEGFMATKLSEYVDIRNDGADLTGDGLFLQRIGGLPTEADVEQAFRAPGVEALLKQLLTEQLILAEVESTPDRKRTRHFNDILDALRRSRDQAEERLMQAMDTAGPYRNFALVMRAYRRWEL